MNHRQHILVLSSDLDNRAALTALLQSQGFSPLQASRLSDCRDLLGRKNVSLIFCESRLADGTYHDLLAIADAHNLAVPVVVTSRLADWDEYLEALRHGAVDLIASPCKNTDVTSAIAQAQLAAPGISSGDSRHAQPELRAHSASGD